MAETFFPNSRTQIELHGEQLNRRRRRSVLCGLAGIIFVVLLGAWFFLYWWDLDFVPKAWLSIFSILNFGGLAFWIGWWTLAVAAGVSGLAAIGLGSGGLSKVNRESRSLAVAGILLGLGSCVGVGVLFCVLIVTIQAFLLL